MEQRNELIRFCKKVYEKEFVSGYDGNLSLRADDNSIIITPSGKNKGEVEPEDLLIIDLKGNLIEGYSKVSTEARIHLLAYNSRKDINAVVHCHPPHATAFATIGEDFTRPVFPEILLTLGKVPLCKYGTPSTDELPASMTPYIEYANAMLLENHGAVTFGKDIKDAYYKMEKLEHMARTLFIARQLGREKTLPLMKVKELYSISEDTYGVKIDKRNRFGY